MKIYALVFLPLLAVTACATQGAGSATRERFGLLDQCPYGYDSERDCGVEEPVVAAAAPAPAPAPVAAPEPAPAAPPPPPPVVEAPPPPPPPVVVAPPPPPPAPRVVVTDKKFELREVVYFDTAKASIQQRSHSLLEEAAAAIKQHPEVKKIVVEGHTDSVGAKTYNTKLSQQRAEAVRKFLVEKGVESGRVAAKGFGPTRPIADNGTPDGRERNRRVELTIEQ